MNKDKPTSLEGNLEDIAKDLRPGAEASSKYIVHIPAGRPGTREGIGFKICAFGVDAKIFTAAERVTVIVDESCSVPWASVEMDTGLFYTTLKISRAELEKVTCLKEAKKN